MARKQDILEEKYKQYSATSPEKLKTNKELYEITSEEKLEEKLKQEYLTPVEQKLEELNKKRDNLKQEIEHSQDVRKKATKIIELEDLSDLIKENEKEMQQAKEQVKKELFDFQREKKLQVGFEKNKDKIEKIRNYKNQMARKLTRVNADRESIKSRIELLSKSKEIVDKKLEKETEKLTNNEYNALLIERQEKEKELEDLKKKLQGLDKKVESLQEGMSKCDLAWKNLFLGNSWDDIHARTMERKLHSKKKDNTIDEKKVADKLNKEADRIKQEEELKLQKAEKEAYKKEHPIRSVFMNFFTGKNKNTQLKEEKTTEAKEIAIVDEFKQNHPRLAKIRDWFKGVDTKTDKSMEKIEEKDKISIDSNQKDAFIEELRRHVEKDKSDKEQEYINIHKKKNSVKEDTKEKKEENIR